MQAPADVSVDFPEIMPPRIDKAHSLLRLLTSIGLTADQISNHTGGRFILPSGANITYMDGHVRWNPVAELNVQNNTHLLPYQIQN